MAYTKYSFREKLQLFSPITCRILARVSGKHGEGIRALSDEEIAAGSGLSVPEIIKIYRSPSWDKIKIQDMFMFLKGCGIDLDNAEWFKENVKYMKSLTRRKSGLPKYIIKSQYWETVFKPILVIEAKNQGYI